MKNYTLSIITISQETLLIFIDIRYAQTIMTWISIIAIRAPEEHHINNDQYTCDNEFQTQY